jgi:hypothetical protein
LPFSGPCQRYKCTKNLGSGNFEINATPSSAI